VTFGVTLALEEAFDREIPDKEAERIGTVREAEREV
jgi:acyl carrier protein